MRNFEDLHVTFSPLREEIGKTKTSTLYSSMYHKQEYRIELEYKLKISMQA